MKVIGTILSILLIVGIGFGGYYLGWYLDKQAAARQAEEMKSVNKVFNDSDLGIKFTYPGDWSSVSDNTVEGARTITTESPNGSIFGYSLNTQSSGKMIACDEDLPNGDGKTVKKCEFVHGSFTYARYLDTDDKADNGDLWLIAEKGAETEENSYLYKSSDGFYFRVKDPQDLATLDKIMKSVIRSK